MSGPPIPLEDNLEGLRTEVVRAIREQTGLHEQFAIPIAAKIIEVVWRRCAASIVAGVAGEKVYVPVRDPNLAEKVLAEFNGRNRDELIERYGISRTTFYDYIKRSRPKPSPAPSRPEDFSI